MDAREETPRLEDVKRQVELASVDELKLISSREFGNPFFIKWHNLEFVCDEHTGWAFADFSKWDTTRNPNSMWEIVTHAFDSLDSALDFPLLNGKSIRERFRECTFFIE